MKSLTAITGRQLQIHLAKRRKVQEDDKVPASKVPESLELPELPELPNLPCKKLKPQKTLVRPGCKESKVTKDTCNVPGSTEERKELLLLNYPSVEKFVTPLVSTIAGTAKRKKAQLVIDFNRPPYDDERFRFVGYSMVYVSRHVKQLAIALTLAASVCKEVVPIYFERDGIRIKKREYDDASEENFVFEIHFHHLLQYYCHVPMGFLLNEIDAQTFAKRHCNQSGECSVIWKYNRDDRIVVNLLDDHQRVYKRYEIPVLRTFDPLVTVPPMQDKELSWHVNLKQFSQSCDELSLWSTKDACMTFRIWGNAVEIFCQNEKNFHVFGVTKEQPVREDFQFSFAVNMACLRKVCSRMKKSKGQQKTLTISVDSNPENYVQFSQHLSEQITFQWWLPKQIERN